MEVKPRLTHVKLIDWEEKVEQQQLSITPSTQTLTGPKPRLTPHVKLIDWEEDIQQPIIVPNITPQEPLKGEEQRQKIPVIVPVLLREETLPTVSILPREKPQTETVKIPSTLPSALPKVETIFEQTPISETSPALEVPQAQTAKTVAKTLQQTSPILTPPTPTQQKFRGPLPRFGSQHEGVRAPDFGRLLFGGKYVKRHEIALPSQVAKQVLTVSTRSKAKTGVGAPSSLIFGKPSRRGAGLGGAGLHGGLFSSFVFDVGGGRRGSRKSLLKGSLAEVVFG
jgi:hypothetical protein